MISIRNANIKDIQDVVQCGRTSLPISYTSELLEKMFRNKDIKIYLVYNKPNKQIYGFVIIKINNPKHIHILSIAIYSNVRKNGIGTYLFNYLKSHYPLSSITLYVQVSNIIAMNFYFKNYFKLTNYLPGYYSQLQVKDAYEMTYIPSNSQNSKDNNLKHLSNENLNVF